VILVDTSIWVNHLRPIGAGPSALLNRAEVIQHPMIVGELAPAPIRRRHSRRGDDHHSPPIADYLRAD
jgi:hypothetical protein